MGTPSATLIFNSMGVHECGGAGQTSVTASLMTESGITEGHADLGMPALWVGARSTTDKHQVILQATIEDYLLFTVSTGSADLNISIGGNWKFTDLYNNDTPQVEVIFSWYRMGDTSSYRSWDSGTYATGYHYGDAVFKVDRTSGDSKEGIYSFNVPTLTIANGEYRLGMSVKAYAGNGDTAYINDPVIFNLPDGVTFASASGSIYSGAAPVPLPGALFLLAPGLVGVAAMRRRPRA